MVRKGATPRLIVVVALMAVSLAWSLPDLRRVFGSPLGSFGFESQDSIVTEVDRGGAADRAGVRVGDRVAIGDSSPLARYALARGGAPRPGVGLTATISRGASSRAVNLVAAPESPPDRAFVALRFALAFFTIGVATALLLTRPDLAAWGFFLYCLSAISLPGATLTMALGWKIRTLSQIPFELQYGASQIGGVIFAFAFARDSLLGWRRNSIVALSVIVAATAALDLYGAFTGSLGRSLGLLDTLSTGLVVLAMLVGFLDSYRHDSGTSRQRLRWMIAALVVSIPANYIATWGFPGWLTYGQYVGLIAVQAVVPLTAAYALFRKRVVDLNFVISRTLVYGTLTALLVIVFSTLDAVLAKAFAESRVSLTIDIAVALLLGFTLNSAHRQIDGVIDRVLFRERHRAEMQLKRSAAGVVHATDEAAITDAVVRLPVHALKLGGSAAYAWSDGAFARTAADGQLAGLPAVLDANDPLPLALRAELQPVRTDSVPLTAVRSAHVSTEPVVAIPISMRGELNGFTVYAAHTSGADIDPDEESALVSLARSAAVAYDHLEVAVLRARVATLESKLASGPASEST